MAVAVDHLKRSAATSRRSLVVALALVLALHLNLPATGRVIRLRRMRQSKISAATSAAPTVLFMVIVRPFQFHVSDLVRRCLTARLADPPLVSILNYLHHPFSLDRRASALPKSKASQRNEPNYQFFYMSYYAAAHLLELKPIDDLDLKSRKKARQIARRKQHTCVVCGHAITFTDERQGPEIIVVAKPFDRGDYLGRRFAGSAHQEKT